MEVTYDIKLRLEIQGFPYFWLYVYILHHVCLRCVDDQKAFGFWVCLTVKLFESCLYGFGHMI